MKLDFVNLFWLVCYTLAIMLSSAYAAESIYALDVLESNMSGWIIWFAQLANYVPVIDTDLLLTILNSFSISIKMFIDEITLIPKVISSEYFIKNLLIILSPFCALGVGVIIFLYFGSKVGLMGILTKMFLFLIVSLPFLIGIAFFSYASVLVFMTIAIILLNILFNYNRINIDVTKYNEYKLLLLILLYMGFYKWFGIAADEYALPIITKIFLLFVFIFNYWWLYQLLRACVINFYIKDHLKLEGSRKFKAFVKNFKLVSIIIFLIILVSLFYLKVPNGTALWLHLVFSAFVLLLMMNIDYLLSNFVYIRAYLPYISNSKSLFNISDRFNSLYRGFLGISISNIMQVLYKIVVIFLACSVLMYIWGLTYIFEYLSWLSNNSTMFNIIVNVGIAVFVIVIATWCALFLLQNSFLKWHDKKENDKINRILSLMILLKRPYMFIVGAVIIITVILSLNMSIEVFLAGTGIFTVAFIFAAKSVVGNLMSSVNIFLNEVFFIGDIVDISGKIGEVEDISLNSVKLRDLEGRLHIIPFHDISAVTNYSSAYGYALVVVSVSYDSDIDKVKECLLSSVQQKLKVDREVKDLLSSELEVNGVVAMSDSSIDIRCRIKTLPARQFEVQRKLLEIIKKEFDKHNIEIPYPHTAIVFPSK